MSSFPAIYAANMTDQQRAMYYAELSVVEKDETVGVLLAIFLGTFGAHHFYMRRTGLGILYCVLCVTGFSTIAGFVEAFFMPERVRRFNATQAGMIAARLGVYAPSASGPGTSYPAQPYPPAQGYPAAASFVAASPAVPATLAAVTCPACGTVTSGGMKFCAHCGGAL